MITRPSAETLRDALLKMWSLDGGTERRLRDSLDAIIAAAKEENIGAVWDDVEDRYVLVAV